MKYLVFARPTSKGNWSKFQWDAPESKVATFLRISSEHKLAFLWENNVVHHHEEVY